MKKWVTALGIVLVLPMAGQLPEARADSAPQSYDCDHLPAQVDSHVTAQCAAAKEAQDAASKNKTLSYVYAGVTAVCLSACVSFSDWAGYCQYSSLGAAGVDAVMTQNFGAAMMAVPVMMNGSFGSSAQSAAQGAQKSGGDKASCVAATMSGLEMVIKRKSAQAAQESSDSLTSSLPTLTSNGEAKFVPAQMSNMGSMGSSGSLAATSSGGVSGTGGVSSACATGAQTGNAAAVTQCAAATDSTLGGVVNDPKFLDGIKKATGMNPSDFFAKAAAEGPEAAVASALGSDAALGSSAGSALSKIFAAMDSQVGGLEKGSFYAGGRGRGGSGGSGDDFGKTMADLMSKLNGGEAEKKAASAAGKSQFGAERFPASVAEDRKVSLFERVTYRYQLISSRLIDLAQPAAAAPMAPPAAKAQEVRTTAAGTSLGQPLARPY